HEEAKLDAVLRDVPDAARPPALGRPRGDVLAAERDPALFDLPQADDGLDQLLLAFALDAGDPDDLAAMDWERNVLEQPPVALAFRPHAVDGELDDVGDRR